ncbi:MAG: PorT family protein [Bacteroidales bacterium]|nr:PorT family protein [Bacteroidales bacterium]
MKRFITILFLLIIPVALYSQRFKGGILLGLNVSQIDGDSYAGFNKAGLVAGAYVFTEFTENWSAQMEIRYAEKGSSTPFNYSDPIKYRLQYVEIPLVVKYKLFKNFKLEAGLSFGYLFAAAQKDAAGYFQFEEIPDRTETAICIGLTYDLFDRLTVGARGSYSLFPIWGDPLESYGKGAWFNSVITFGLYYRIEGKQN